MENKFTLSDASIEEQKAFMADLEALVKKHSLYLEAIPQFKRSADGNSFEAVATLLVQKVTEVVAPEVVPEGSVPSTDPEVNPAISNDSAETA